MLENVVLHVHLFSMRYTQLRALEVNLLQTGSFSCISKDVIYCIECTSCREIYIGELERRIGDRIREHLRDVKNKNRHNEVAIHFNSFCHSLDHFRVQVLYENINGNLARKIKESYFIMKFGCVYPLGMNKDNGIVV